MYLTIFLICSIMAIWVDGTRSIWSNQAETPKEAKPSQIYGVKFAICTRRSQFVFKVPEDPTMYVFYGDFRYGIREKYYPKMP